MQISTDNIKLLLKFQRLDGELGDSREVETEQVFQLLDVLKEEASERGLEVYTHLVQQHHPDTYPWAAVRVMDYGELPAPTATVTERQIKRAPAALVLILDRRPELEPHKVGDEINIKDPKWKSLWTALTNWKPAVIDSRIGANGWKPKQENIKLPGPITLPWQPPINPVPRPPIPDPPADQGNGPINDLPPIQPPGDTPEDEPPAEEPPVDEAPPVDELPDEGDEVDSGDLPEETPSPPDWKEVGKTAAWAVGVGALAFWLGKQMSA